MFQKRRLLSKASAGFTLVELLVSLGIFAVVTALVLMKHQSFSGGILLTNLAYETALTVRRAQSFGINVKGQGPVFDIWYGVHFDRSKPTEFLLFADSNKNTTYEGTGACDGIDTADECFEKVLIKRNMSFNQLCIAGPSAEDCNRNIINIIFKRPDPEARIYDNDVPGTAYGSVKIVLVASDGRSKNVVVRKTGQISVE
ncbi:MAG TPA: prepilin-type N-terminal cleavage/methylation domain-containing protein [Candidatus Paceibacterota bacterium]